MKNIFRKIFTKKKDPLSSDEKLELIEKSSKLVGPGVFYSTLIKEPQEMGGYGFTCISIDRDGRKIVQPIGLDKILYIDC